MNASSFYVLVFIIYVVSQDLLSFPICGICNDETATITAVRFFTGHNNNAAQLYCLSIVAPPLPIAFYQFFSSGSMVSKKSSGSMHSSGSIWINALLLINALIWINALLWMNALIWIHLDQKNLLRGCGWEGIKTRTYKLFWQKNLLAHVK